MRHHRKLLRRLRDLCPRRYRRRIRARRVGDCWRVSCPCPVDRWEWSSPEVISVARTRSRALQGALLSLRTACATMGVRHVG